MRLSRSAFICRTVVILCKILCNGVCFICKLANIFIIHLINAILSRVGITSDDETASTKNGIDWTMSNQITMVTIQPNEIKIDDLVDQVTRSDVCYQNCRWFKRAHYWIIRIPLRKKKQFHEEFNFFSIIRSFLPDWTEYRITKKINYFFDGGIISRTDAI